MITAVLDTNVLVSGFVRHREDSPPVRVLDAWRARSYSLVVSEHILTEVAHTFEERYFRQRLTPSQRANDLALLRDEAIIIPLTVEIHGVATHQEDDLVLATAVSARADYLVTGDTKLQKLGKYQSVTILSPRAFLEILTTQPG